MAAPSLDDVPTINNMRTWDVARDRLGLYFFRGHTLKARGINVGETVLVAHPNDLRCKIQATVLVLFDDHPFEAAVKLPDGTIHRIEGIFIKKLMSS